MTAVTEPLADINADVIGTSEVDLDGRLAMVRAAGAADRLERSGRNRSWSTGSRQP